MVIDRERLEELARLTSDEGIVSLYLRFEPRLMYERGLATKRFKSAWKRFERREPSDSWKRAARRERDRIETFLNDWAPPEGRGLAIFACEPEGLWEVLPIDAPLPTWLAVATTTQTRPLTQLLDEFPRLLVCVVQRDRATLYVSEQREARRVSSLESDVPGRHSRGGWSQARFARHREFHIEKHLVEVVRELEEIHEKQPFDRLILGGTAEIAAETERLLPEPLRSLLIGSVPVDVKHESEDEILEKARAASRQAERKEEEELVRLISDRAASGGRGVTGLPATLRALSEGRIQQMILAEDFVRDGWECAQCGYAAPSEFGSCPLCGGPAQLTPNVVDGAVERAFLNGAKINYVFEGAAREHLSEIGNVGALLRF